MRAVAIARTLTCVVVLGRAPVVLADAAATQPAAPATQPARAAKPKLGIAVGEARDWPGQKGLIDQLGGHLIVQAVLPKSRAERMGLKSADVIRRINGKDVDTVREVQDAVRETDKLFEIDILRHKEPMTLREQPNIS